MVTRRSPQVRHFCCQDNNSWATTRCTSTWLVRERNNVLQVNKVKTHVGIVALTSILRKDQTPSTNMRQKNMVLFGAFNFFFVFSCSTISYILHTKNCHIHESNGLSQSLSDQLIFVTPILYLSFYLCTNSVQNNFNKVQNKFECEI